MSSRQSSTIVKRKIPKSTPSSAQFFYINKNTALHPLLKKVRRHLVQNAGKHVTLCGMGAAINKTSFLALQIQDMLGGASLCGLNIRTGTVDIIDEVHPSNADEDIKTQIRRNSKIEIELCVGKH